MRAFRAARRQHRPVLLHASGRGRAHVSRKHAMELALTGALYSAAEAERIGLVNRVVPAGSAASRAQRYGRRPRVAIGRNDRDRQTRLPAADRDSASPTPMHSPRAQWSRISLHPDADEGIGAFLEKRPPATPNGGGTRDEPRLLSRGLYPRHPRRREDDRDGRRLGQRGAARPFSSSNIWPGAATRCCRSIQAWPAARSPDSRSIASLAEAPGPIDMVEIFRNSEAAGAVVDEALALDPRPASIWMQLGVRNDAAAGARRGAGRQGGDEPLPENRIWPAVRRDRLERRQFARPFRAQAGARRRGISEADDRSRLSASKPPAGGGGSNLEIEGCARPRRPAADGRKS